MAQGLVDLKKGDYPGWEGQVRAERGLDATVAALRSIYDDPSAARAKGQRGRTLLRDLFAPVVVGARVRELLEGLGCLDGAETNEPGVPEVKASARAAKPL